MREPLGKIPNAICIGSWFRNYFHPKIHNLPHKIFRLCNDFLYLSEAKDKVLSSMPTLANTPACIASHELPKRMKHGNCAKKVDVWLVSQHSLNKYPFKRLEKHRMYP